VRTGPKAKPTQLHRLHGTYNTTRHRQRDGEAEAPGDLKAIEAPADLSAAEREIWDHAVKNAPAGILKDIDAHVLRVWCQAQARYMTAVKMQAKLDERAGLQLLVKSKAGELVASPYEGIINRAARLSIRMSELLGFCPVGRAGLTAKGEAASEPDDVRWTTINHLRRKAANG
jgi:phage terminase small subunit